MQVAHSSVERRVSSSTKTLLVTGAVRLKRFGAWRRARSVRLTPTLMPTRFALHVGLVGYF